jgi:hypothetical protein
MNMKFILKGLLVLSACVAAMGFASCATGRAKQRTVILDSKGAAHGIQTPEWVLAYDESGNFKVEALSAYKSEHCFVVHQEDKSRDFAVGWVEHANGPALIAQMISETVLADAKSKTSGARGDGVDAEFESLAHEMAEASFTGMRRAADWWEIVRNKSTKVEEARAYALFTFDKKRLDEQIAANLANIVENNKALSATAREIYRDLIADIRANGFNNRTR